MAIRWEMSMKPVYQREVLALLAETDDRGLVDQYFAPTVHSNLSQSSPIQLKRRINVGYA